MNSRPSLRALIEARKRRDRLVVVGFLVVAVAGYVTLTARLDAALADIRGMSQTALAVARMDAEIRFIKESASRLEAAQGAQHAEVKGLIRRLQDELRYSRTQGDPEIPLTIKSMIPEPGQL